MTAPADLPAPPIAERRPSSRTVHGVELVDDYAWLRDDNWQAVMRDPSVLREDVRAYLEAENAYTAAVMADTEVLQKALFEEMKGRIKEDDSSPPSPDGDWAYYRRFETGGQYAILCRIPRDGGDEHVYFHGDREAEGHNYFRLGGATHTDDHRLLAYGLDTQGSELFTLRVRDLETGVELDDVVEGTTGYGIWNRAGDAFLYGVRDENMRPYAVRMHRVGTSADADVEIFRSDDPGKFVGVGMTQDRSLAVISLNDHESSELRIIPSDDFTAEPRLVAARRDEVEYDVDRHGDRLIILTNADGAEDFKLATAPLAEPGADNWQDLVPHRPGTLILSHSVLADHLVWMERRDALPRIVVRRLSDGETHEIAFDEEAYALGLSAGYEYDTTTIRFSYESPTTPSQTWDYDVETRERVLVKEQEVPSGHDPADYVARRLQATSHDGETVPITVLHHRDTPLDGSAPCLLYGYGSYGHSIPADFSVVRLSLVDRGFVYAVAHIRGGKEKGHRWYTDGKREKKVNTFLDFVACGEHLAAEGFTSAGRIAAMGGSAGGMLMGAVANLRPDLFHAIVAEVPFVDVLATMLDDTLPLTPPEWPEWGNPIESREAFDAIRAYSPYDNVEAKDYPHFWVDGGLSDPRVTYWEPAKWVARLRATKTDDNLALMKINMEAGHGGKSGRFQRLEEYAEVYAFLLKVFDLA